MLHDERAKHTITHNNNNNNNVRKFVGVHCHKSRQSLENVVEFGPDAQRGVGVEMRALQIYEHRAKGCGALQMRH
jgi:Leucine-rich repeat (LRR) protein